jgi:hypothetical protein
MPRFQTDILPRNAGDSDTFLPVPFRFRRFAIPMPVHLYGRSRLITDNSRRYVGKLRIVRPTIEQQPPRCFAEWEQQPLFDRYFHVRKGGTAAPRRRICLTGIAPRSPGVSRLDLTDSRVFAGRPGCRPRTCSIALRVDAGNFACNPRRARVAFSGNWIRQSPAAPAGLFHSAACGDVTSRSRPCRTGSRTACRLPAPGPNRARRAWWLPRQSFHRSS